jgi:hypothetical protein
LVSYTGQYGSWQKFSQRDYLFKLPDGRSMTIRFGAFADATSDAALDDFASRVIGTLRPRS